MFWTKKISKTAKYTIIKNYGQLKGGQAQAPPPLNTPLVANEVPRRSKTKQFV